MTQTTETLTKQAPTPTVSPVKTYTGGCHCGAVRFEAQLDLSQPVSRCNCTICTKLGGTTTLVKPSAFRLLSGEESLSQYRLKGSPNYRAFCKHCGAQCYGAGNVAELGGDFCSVNVNCLDNVDPNELPCVYWDGRHDNWAAGPRNAPWPIRA
ncbi:GFA family protein [Hyalangium gracile]|uniref:GFA family protein n=1 Tax=Hyalangium gracile TaxID=394092 RepID=UPI001CCE198F|nr:GFA family protein [Hyalangium gracile]